jgi:uncharacterized membrane protein
MANISNLIFVPTLLATLGCGLIAGAFFAFSSFVMTALARIPSAEGMAAMQSINIVVINPIFLGVFVGTAILCAALTLLSIFRWHEPGTAFLLGGGLFYIVGTFLVTMAFNVPLNDALAAANPASTEGVNLWERYVDVWTVWNHVRTAAALAATASLIVGLIYRGA